MVPKVTADRPDDRAPEARPEQGSASISEKFKAADEIPHLPEPIDRMHRHAHQIDHRIADDPDGQRKARRQHDKGQEQVGTRHRSSLLRRDQLVDLGRSGAERGFGVRLAEIDLLKRRRWWSPRPVPIAASAVRTWRSAACRRTPSATRRWQALDHPSPPSAPAGSPRSR